MFTSQPVLHLPDLSAPFAISTDASKHASGGVLLQKDINNEWRPCAYLSQTFGPAECNYNIYDRELLAVMRALDAWCHYLLGSPTTVQVFTDHKNLTYFRQPQNLNRQQARWLLDLSEFDLTLSTSWARISVLLMPCLTDQITFLLQTWTMRQSPFSLTNSLST